MYYLRLKFDNDASIDIYPYEDELSQRWFNEVKKILIIYGNVIEFMV